MDIRTKLIVILVAVSLTSMWLLGYFAYRTSATLLQDISERHLDALAESKARDVTKVIESWQDNVRLIASRTQLRINLDEYNEVHAPDLVASMTRIIDDAQLSAPNIIGIALYGGDGLLVARTGIAAGAPAKLAAIPAALEHVADPGPDAQEAIAFTGPMRLQSRTIGAVTVWFSRDDLRTVTGDFTGLGLRGETIIAQRDGDVVKVLHPLRHPVGPDVDPQINTLVEAATRGVQSTFMQNHHDYSGAEVWGATRFIDLLDWGLTVQVDASEEMQSIHSLRSTMIDLALALSAFAILGGTLLGAYLAKPIRHLAGVVEKVRAGDTSLRADVSREDEIGDLARALNDMLDRRPAP